MLNPQNIHCLALNYDGVGSDDMESPLYFIKSRLSFCQGEIRIPYPMDSLNLWTEVELGIVIGKAGELVPVEDAYEYIEGFVVCADLTCSNLKDRDHHLAFSKSRRFFCPMSIDVVKVDVCLLNSLEMKTEINGRLTQHGSTSQMRYGPCESLSYISRLVPLIKGDVVLTGTPRGHENNTLQRGDTVRHVIANVGELNYEIV